MSPQEAGIEIYQGYGAEQLDTKPDSIVVGNVMNGMPVIERMLNEHLKYVSGPGFLEELYLREKTVLAVSGTHCNTTTTAIRHTYSRTCRFKSRFLSWRYSRELWLLCSWK